jgi:hypothetical protein
MRVSFLSCAMVLIACGQPSTMQDAGNGGPCSADSGYGVGITPPRMMAVTLTCRLVGPLDGGAGTGVASCPIFGTEVSAPDGGSIVFSLQDPAQVSCDGLSVGVTPMSADLKGGPVLSLFAAASPPLDDGSTLQMLINIPLSTTLGMHAFDERTACAQGGSCLGFDVDAVRFQRPACKQTSIYGFGLPTGTITLSTLDLVDAGEISLSVDALDILPYPDDLGFQERVCPDGQVHYAPLP